MKKKKHASFDAVEMRRRAEEKLREKQAGAAAQPGEADVNMPLHELQVRQIQLEMQNEELIASRAEIAAGRNAYAELYDFAPVGYFTLAPDGAIR
jgi:hypothetical protein